MIQSSRRGGFETLDPGPLGFCGACQWFFPQQWESDILAIGELPPSPQTSSDYHKTKRSFQGGAEKEKMNTVQVRGSEAHAVTHTLFSPSRVTATDRSENPPRSLCMVTSAPTGIWHGWIYRRTTVTFNAMTSTTITTTASIHFNQILYV